MTDPKVTLHDVSVEGAADPGDVVDAVRDAVAAAVAEGTPTQDAVRTAVASSVARRSRP